MAFFKKNQSNKRKIAISVCGSGGHVLPGVSLADFLIKNNYDVFIFCDKRGFEFIKKNNNEIPKEKIILFENISYKKNLKNFLNLFKVFFQIIKLIKKNKISFLVSFGSYLGLISVFSAFSCRKKIAIHEGNIIFGFANKISAIFSDFIFLNFPSVKINRFYQALIGILNKKIFFTGMPMRDKILSYYFEKSHNINYDIIYQIGSYENINLLVLGGSQGSEFITKNVSLAVTLLPTLFKFRLKVFHQTKKDYIKNLQDFYQANNIKAEVFEFKDDIGYLMSQAHICITRSGASTLSELSCLGVPSILIPMKFSANNHQYENAKYYNKKEAAMILTESELNSSKLSIFLGEFFSNTALLPLFKNNIQKLSKPNSKEIILQIINDFFDKKNEKNNEKSKINIKQNKSSFQVERGYIVR